MFSLSLNSKYFILSNKKETQLAKTILRKNKGRVLCSLISNYTIVQSYSNQNSMVLAPKQTHRSKEQKREARSEPNPHLYGKLIYNKEYTMGKRQSLQ